GDVAHAGAVIADAGEEIERRLENLRTAALRTRFLGRALDRALLHGGAPRAAAHRVRHRVGRRHGVIMLDAQNPKRTPTCASNGGSVAVYTPKRGFGVR